jgi:hypothetical protein
MADLKYHWAIPVSDPSKHRNAWKAYVGGHYVQACGRQYTTALAETAVLFVAKVKANSDWYCSDCAKAARLALAKESAPTPTPRPARSCSDCRSGAINPGHHGRDESADLDLCDVCYWRKRACFVQAEKVVNSTPRTDSDRYAELRALVEAWQTNRAGIGPLLDWRHR